ncbi:MAG TPA: NAD-dependent epimerase/dehydratase family protein [Acidimicrobiales bacterium]|nr:NAD-dependent epimerase/dehydratase family protein [Acidimicrobiales bacterium]
MSVPNPLVRPVGDDDLVLVTGAAGFIGSHIVKAALARGCRVRAMVEPGDPALELEGLDVERADVDVRDRAAVMDAVAGTSLVIHTAAVYKFWAPDPDVFYDVNVDGTIHVIEAAGAAGLRTVYTSTVGTLGLRADRQPATESERPRIDQLYGHYKRSKYVAEHEALRLAAQGADVVLGMPTFPVGDGDRAPTPTGGTILRFLNHQMPGFVDTVLNVVDVADVAEGHLLAAERGRTGRSYIFGGRDFTLAELLHVLADHTGLPAPTRHVPEWVALGAARASDFFEGTLLRREPHVPLEAARMSAKPMPFDDTRARTELGYTSGPPEAALARAADWFRAHGYAPAG